MKIKGFRDWLGESTRGVQDYGKLGTVAKWYDDSTDFSQLFGTGIWCIKYWDGRLDRLEEILARLAELAGAEMRPIAASVGTDGTGRVKAWFGSNIAKADLGRFSDAIDELRVKWKGLGIGVVAANYSGVREIDLGKLKTEQLFTILDWSRGTLSAEGVETLRTIMQQLPNWRDDRTDWVLDDWLGEASDEVASLLAEARRWGGPRFKCWASDDELPHLESVWSRLDWSLKWGWVPHEKGYYYSFDRFWIELGPDGPIITPTIKWEVTDLTWSTMSDTWHRQPLVELRDRFQFTGLTGKAQLEVAIKLRNEAHLQAAQSPDPALLQKLWKQRNPVTYRALAENPALPFEVVMELYHEVDEPEIKKLIQSHSNFGDSAEWALGDW
jgi:hypothetical protein